MNDNTPICNLWDDDFDDPAEAIWFMCQHLDHIGKTSNNFELMDIADYIQRHLDVLSPAPEDDS